MTTPTDDGALAVPRFASDVRRNVTSLAIAAGVCLIYQVLRVVFASGQGTVLSVTVVSCFIFWSAYSLSYLVLTYVTFRYANPQQLEAWLKTTAPTRRLKRIEAELSGAGPTAAAQWSILAIAAVGLLAISPNLIDDPVANALSFAVVGSAWLVTVGAYAVHYARLNTEFSGLEFPGKDDLTFPDYIYLSVQVMTTFSSSDVSITTPRARRVVTGHTLVAFAFNTFIIALLIATLFLQN